MAKFAKTFLMAAAVAGGVLTASAQTNTTASASTDVCGARTDLVERLSLEFKENQTAVGTLHDSAILEVFVSPQGTWTILATGTDGRSCVLAAGENFEIALTAIGVGA